MPRKKKAENDLPTAMPWAKFWWEKWLGDAGLRSCSVAARGVWMDLLCLAAREQPFGHISINGRPATTDQLSRFIGIPAAELETHLNELEDAGVFSRRGSVRSESDGEAEEAAQKLEAEGVFPKVQDGTIYSRRMVRDLHKYREDVRNGRRGGNPNLPRPPQDPVSDDLDGEGVNPGVKAKEEKRNRREESVPASQDAGASEGGRSSEQGTLLQLGPVPLTPYQRLKEEGFPLLAKILGLNLEDQPARTRVGKLLNRFHNEAAHDDETLLEIIRDTAGNPPRQPESWITAQIKAKCRKPRLVVSNDPNDLWGIQAWCKTIPGVKPTTDPLDQRAGNWLLGTHIIDRVARNIAQAAGFPTNWRGDWSPLLDWLQAGLDPRRDIVPTVERLSGIFTEPATTLNVFTKQVLARRAA